MAKEFVCDICGYRPRRNDAYNIILDEGLDQLDVPIHYVRCYSCGNEWVE